MPKKSKSLALRPEVLQPVRAVPDVRAALEQMVEQKIAEMMADKSDGMFEPFFQLKAIAVAIKRLQTVPQQRKWAYYYEDWGCLICGTKKDVHFGLGMCSLCYQKVHSRLASCLKRAAADKSGDTGAVRDLSDMARAALRRRP